MTSCNGYINHIGCKVDFQEVICIAQLLSSTLNPIRVSLAKLTTLLPSLACIMSRQINPV